MKSKRISEAILKVLFLITILPAIPFIAMLFIQKEEERRAFAEDFFPRSIIKKLQKNRDADIRNPQKIKEIEQIIPLLKNFPLDQVRSIKEALLLRLSER